MRPLLPEFFTMISQQYCLLYAAATAWDAEALPRTKQGATRSYDAGKKRRHRRADGDACPNFVSSTVTPPQLEPGSKVFQHTTRVALQPDSEKPETKNNLAASLEPITNFLRLFDLTALFPALAALFTLPAILNDDTGRFFKVFSQLEQQK